MARTRTILSLLSVGWVVMAALNAGRTAGAALDQMVTMPELTAAGEPCPDPLECPSACSPLAGAWVARLSSPAESILHTFKFVPVNQECSVFAVNAQAAARSTKAIKLWPEATHLTEFVGSACTVTWNDLQFTVVGYGVQRTPMIDRVVFIQVLTGRIVAPRGCVPCTGLDPSDPAWKELSDELEVTIFVSYFDAAQDQDRDGLPDECEPVLCSCYETRLKRVKLRPPCEELRSFVACLEECKEADSLATGRAFLQVAQDQQKFCFVLTIKDLKDATKAAIRVNGMDVVTLFPFPPETKPRNDDCSGLLSCGCFYVKDCLGPWKNKKFADIVKEIEEGKATVVVCTKKFPAGEIGGKIEDP